MTARDIITDAMMEAQILSQGEDPSDADAQFCLRKLNRMFDRWAAKSVMAYNVSFQEFIPTPNHTPHTIGPTGDFVVDQRPVTIESAQFRLSSGSGQNPAVWTQINIQDDDWWAQQTIPDLQSSIITNLYYSPDWPNGKIYFWPVPQGSNPVKLELWGLLGAAYSNGTVNDTLNTTISLPVGYWDTVINNLAVEIGPAFNAPPNAVLMENARKGLIAIQGNNAESPRIQTMDFGMPKRTSRPDFNFLTGAPWNTR